MAETQNLVQDDMPEDSVVPMGNQEPRSMTCNSRSFVPALSIFVALLVAGQAVCVYFVVQQQGQLTDLAHTTRELKLQDLIKKLPGSSPSQNRPKMKMATFNIPLAFSDDDGSQQKLEKKAKASNSMEDAALYMLQMSNPLRTYPSFNGSILDNLRKLRKTLDYQEWMQFDAWLQQWYQFYLVQNSKIPEATPAPNEKFATGPEERNLLPVEFGASGNMVYASTSYSIDSMPSFYDETPSGAPVMTECQIIKSQVHIVPGAFVPQCDENGGFQPMQCWHSTGYCWCVYGNGTEIPETRSRAKIDCSQAQYIDISGVETGMEDE